MRNNRIAFYLGLEDETTPDNENQDKDNINGAKQPEGTVADPEANVEGSNVQPGTNPTEEPVAPASPGTDLIKKKALVFLGGTCNESTWRETLINGLEISYFNPVTENWTDEAKKQEDEIKASADYNLFVFTPLHTGFFSFVEAAISAIRSPSRTILCVLDEDNGKTFDEQQKHSLDACIAELRKEGIQVFTSLDEVRSCLNGKEPVAEAGVPPAEEPPVETPPASTETPPAAPEEPKEGEEPKDQPPTEGENA